MAIGTLHLVATAPKWHTTGIYAVVLVGSATAVVAVITLAMQVSVQTRGPADFLPVDGTIALSQKPNAAHAALMQQWFPDLQIDATAEAAALVQLENGRRTLVHFYKEDAVPSAGAKRSYPPFIVTARDEESLAPIMLASERGGPSLSSLSPFRSCEKEESCSFFRTSAISNTSDDTASFMWKLLFKETPYALFVGDTDSWRIDTPVKDMLPLGGPPSVTSYHGDDGFLLYGQELQEAVLTFLSNLPAPHNQLTPALLGQAIVGALGPDLSFEFDFLSLLNREGVLELEQTQSGTILYTIQGILPEREAESRLMRLHDIAGAGAHAIAIERRQFDDQFDFENLRLAEEAQRESETIAGWEVIQTMAGNNTVRLLTASRGGRFIVSNNPKVLELLGNAPTMKTEGAAYGGRLNGPPPFWPLRGSGGMVFAQKPILWSLSQRTGIRSFQAKATPF